MRERRQIAETMDFDARHTPHINFQKVAERAQSLRANLDIRNHADGGCTVTIYWTNKERERQS